MPKTEKAYTDIDYDSFAPADLSLDIHWIWLPTAVIREREKAQREAEEQARLAALPEDHKIILVPADPHHSPTERELWPLINRTVQKALEPYPEILTAVLAAIRRTIDEHRGWRNPFPKPA